MDVLEWKVRKDAQTNAERVAETEETLRVFSSRFVVLALHEEYLRVTARGSGRAPDEVRAITEAYYLARRLADDF